MKDRMDPRVRREEEIVHVRATEGELATLDEGQDVSKVLCMCEPEEILRIEASLKGAFPSLSIVRSSDVMLEVMEGGADKRSAVTWMCDLWGIPLDRAVAFGDHYNDVGMLEAVGTPFLMGNAPDELKARFRDVVPDNDSEGIYHALRRIGLIPDLGI